MLRTGLLIYVLHMYLSDLPVTAPSYQALSCLACAGCYAYFTTASDNVEPRPVELRKGEARGSKEEVA